MPRAGTPAVILIWVNIARWTVGACLVAAGLIVAGFSSVRAQRSPPEVQPCPIRLENRQPQSQIRFVLENGTTPDKPLIDTMSGGVALLDFNKDGLLDIFFANGAQLPSLEKSDARFYNRLYRNNGSGTFTDVTARTGLRGEGYTMGAAAADYDNDGWPDLYVTGYNRNLLYHNNHDGTFTDVTGKAKVTAINAEGRKPWSVSAAWLDYDNDGKLDLFVANYLDWTFANSQLCGPPGKRLACPPSLFRPLPNLLFRNNGDGTFSDVSVETGIAAHLGKGMGVAVADYDGDGWMDIFVGNDNERNFLFHNLAGRKFEEVGVEAAVGFNDDGVPVSSMGVDFRDWNNDGGPDVFVTALGGETFPLFRNDGGGLFLNSTYQARIGFSSFRMSGWGAGIHDFDNDGFKDLFSANSHASENADLEKGQSYRQRNAVFWNQRDGTFCDVTGQAGRSWTAAAHRGAAFGDLNNDGKMDAVISVIGGPAEVLINVSETGNHWLLIDPANKAGNRAGIGLSIKVTRQSGTVEYNHVTTAGSYASSNDPRAHFGLGADTLAREVELTWPGGRKQVLKNVKADQVLRVAEP